MEPVLAPPYVLVATASTEVVTDSLGREWDPLKHPRGRDGKFIRTWHKIRAFLEPNGSSPWMTGTTEQIAPDGSLHVRVEHVTDPKNQHYVGHLVDISPHNVESLGEKATLKIGQLAPQKLGKYDFSYDLSQNFFDQAGFDPGMAHKVDALAQQIRAGKVDPASADPHVLYAMALYANSQSGDGYPRSFSDFKAMLDDLGVDANTTDTTPDGLSGVQELAKKVTSDHPNFHEIAPVLPNSVRMAQRNDSDVKVAWFSDGTQAVVWPDGTIEQHDKAKGDLFTAAEGAHHTPGVSPDAQSLPNQEPVKKLWAEEPDGLPPLPDFLKGPAVSLEPDEKHNPLFDENGNFKPLHSDQQSPPKVAPSNESITTFGGGPAMTHDEVDAVRTYTGENAIDGVSQPHVDINDALRADEMPSDPLLEDTVHQLDHLLERSRTTEPVTVWRGLGEREGEGDAWDSFVAQLVPGATLSDKGFVSTGKSQTHAKFFSQYNQNPGMAHLLGSAVLRIDLPSGAQAYDLYTNEKTDFGEDEVLLPRGAQFKVLEVGKQPDGHIYAHLMYIPDGKAYNGSHDDGQHTGTEDVSAKATPDGPAHVDAGPDHGDAAGHGEPGTDSGHGTDGSSDGVAPAPTGDGWEPVPDFPAAGDPNREQDVEDHFFSNLGHEVELHNKAGETKKYKYNGSVDGKLYLIDPETGKETEHDPEEFNALRPLLDDKPKPATPDHIEEPSDEQLSKESQVTPDPYTGTVTSGDTPLTEPEIDAVQQYVNDEEDINTYMRKGVLADGKDWVVDAVSKIRSAIGKRHLTKSQHAYRGFRSWDKPVSVGDEIDDKAFVSTTLTESTAETFAGDPNKSGQPGLLLEFDLPEGFPGIYVDDPEIDAGGYEQEVLLDNEHFFLRISKVLPNDKDGRQRAIAEVVYKSEDKAYNSSHDGSDTSQQDSEGHHEADAGGAPTGGSAADSAGGDGGGVPPSSPEDAAGDDGVHGLTHVADAQSWEKVGGQGGSNQGGTYKAPDGSLHYVKSGKTPHHAKNEALSAALYAEAGIDTAEQHLATTPFDEKLGTESPIVPGTLDLTKHHHDEPYKKEIQKGFVVDAWLANWDVAGTGPDSTRNIITRDSDGAPLRVDPGGSLWYRAQGAPKGGAFGSKVGELETLRDKHSSSAAPLYDTMSYDDEVESAKRVIAISPDRIDQLVDALKFDEDKDQVAGHYGPIDPEKLKATLKARREYIAAHYGLDLPEKQTDPVETLADEAKDVTETDAPAAPKSKFEILDDPGKSGDGYWPGTKMWGKYGAAGVMVRHVDENGTERFLMVQRGPIVSSNKGKWQLPGGALNSNEDDYQGTARELDEELTAPEGYLDSLNPVGEVKFEHESGWHYTNIAADAPEQFEPNVDGTETGDAGWFTKEEIAKLPLHPALESNLDKIFGEFDKADGDAKQPEDAIKGLDLHKKMQRLIELQQQIFEAKHTFKPTPGAPSLKELNDELDKLRHELGLDKPKTAEEKKAEEDALTQETSDKLGLPKDGKYGPGSTATTPEERVSEIDAELEKLDEPNANPWVPGSKTYNNYQAGLRKKKKDLQAEKEQLTHEINGTTPEPTDGEKSADEMSKQLQEKLGTTPTPAFNNPDPAEHYPDTSTEAAVNAMLGYFDDPDTQSMLDTTGMKDTSDAWESLHEYLADVEDGHQKYDAQEVVHFLDQMQQGIPYFPSNHPVHSEVAKLSSQIHKFEDAINKKNTPISNFPEPNSKDEFDTFMDSMSNLTFGDADYHDVEKALEDLNEWSANVDSGTEKYDPKKFDDLIDKAQGAVPDQGYAIGDHLVHQLESFRNQIHELNNDPGHDTPDGWKGLDPNAPVVEYKGKKYKKGADNGFFWHGEELGDMIGDDTAQGILNGGNGGNNNNNTPNAPAANEPDDGPGPGSTDWQAMVDDQGAYRYGAAGKKIRIGDKVTSANDGLTGTIVSFEKNHKGVIVKSDLDGKKKARKNDTLHLHASSTPQEPTKPVEPASTPYTGPELDDHGNLVGQPPEPDTTDVDNLTQELVDSYGSEYEDHYGGNLEDTLPLIHENVMQGKVSPVAASDDINGMAQWFDDHDQSSLGDALRELADAYLTMHNGAHAPKAAPKYVPGDEPGGHAGTLNELTAGQFKAVHEQFGDVAYFVPDGYSFDGHDGNVSIADGLNNIEKAYANGTLDKHDVADMVGYLRDSVLAFGDKNDPKVHATLDALENLKNKFTPPKNDNGKAYQVTLDSGLANKLGYGDDNLFEVADDHGVVMVEHDSDPGDMDQPGYSYYVFEGTADNLKAFWNDVSTHAMPTLTEAYAAASNAADPWGSHHAPYVPTDISGGDFSSHKLSHEGEKLAEGIGNGTVQDGQGFSFTKNGEDYLVHYAENADTGGTYVALYHKDQPDDPIEMWSAQHVFDDPDTWADEATHLASTYTEWQNNPLNVAGNTGNTNTTTTLKLDDIRKEIPTGLGQVLQKFPGGQLNATQAKQYRNAGFALDDAMATTEGSPAWKSKVEKAIYNLKQAGPAGQPTLDKVQKHYDEVTGAAVTPSASSDVPDGFDTPILPDGYAKTPPGAKVIAYNPTNDIYMVQHADGTYHVYSPFGSSMEFSEFGADVAAGKASTHGWVLQSHASTPDVLDGTGASKMPSDWTPVAIHDGDKKIMATSPDGTHHFVSPSGASFELTQDEVDNILNGNAPGWTKLDTPAPDPIILPDGFGQPPAGSVIIGKMNMPTQPAVNGNILVRSADKKTWTLYSKNGSSMEVDPDWAQKVEDGIFPQWDLTYKGESASTPSSLVPPGGTIVANHKDGSVIYQDAGNGSFHYVDNGITTGLDSSVVSDILAGNSPDWTPVTNATGGAPVGSHITVSGGTWEKQADGWWHHLGSGMSTGPNHSSYDTFEEKWKEDNAPETTVPDGAYVAYGHKDWQHTADGTWYTSAGDEAPAGSSLAKSLNDAYTSAPESPLGANYAAIPDGANAMYQYKPDPSVHAVKYADGTYHYFYPDGSIKGADKAEDKNFAHSSDWQLTGPDPHVPPPAAAPVKYGPSKLGWNGKPIFKGDKVKHVNGTIGHVASMETGDKPGIKVYDSYGNAHIYHKNKLQSLETHTIKTAEPPNPSAIPGITPKPVKPTAKKVDPDPSSPWYGQPKPKVPTNPTFPQAPELKYVDDAWMATADANYRARMKAKGNADKPLAQSSTYNQFVKVRDSGDIGELDTLLGQGRITQEMHDDAKTQILANQAKFQKEIQEHDTKVKAIKDAHDAEVTKWREDFKAWSQANGLPAVELKGMTDGVQPWKRHDAVTWMTNHGPTPGALNPTGKLTPEQAQAVQSQKGSNISHIPRHVLKWDTWKPGVLDQYAKDNPGKAGSVKKLQAMQAGMEATPPLEQDVLVLRTFDTQAFKDPDNPDQYLGAGSDITHLVGTIHGDFGFSETTPGSIQGGDSTSGLTMGNVTMEIRVPAGTRGIWTRAKGQHLGSHLHEDGFILEGGLFYYIHSVKWDTAHKRWFVQAEIIPKEHYDEYGQFKNMNPFFD